MAGSKDQKWERGDWWALLGLVIGITALIIGVTVPEIRCALGLECPLPSPSIVTDSSPIPEVLGESAASDEATPSEESGSVPSREESEPNDREDEGASRKKPASKADSEASVVAVDDRYYMVPGEVKRLRVLRNDHHVDGFDIDMVAINGPNGGLILDTDIELGIVNYRAPNEPGAYSFEYIASDGLSRSTGKVTVDVSANRAPVATGDTACTGVGQPVEIPVLRNDGGIGLRIASFQSEGRSGGRVSLMPRGVLRYTPIDGFVGTESFTYVASSSNGLDSNSATVTVSVHGGCDR